MDLLLLPGMHGTGVLFDPLSEKLPASLRSRAVTYPVDQPLGYGELLPIVEAEAAQCGDFIVVGESFSGPLALMLAAKQPKGLRGVVLCVTFVRCPQPWLKRLMAVARGWMMRVRPRWLIFRFVLGRFVDSPIRQKMKDAVDRNSPEVLAARLRAIAGVDASEELRRCKVPILYLQAMEDRIVPAGCLKTIQGIRPDVQVAEFQGPHLLLQTAADDAARALEDFRRSLENCDRPTAT